MTGAKNQGNERILHGKKLVGKHFFYISTPYNNLPFDWEKHWLNYRDLYQSSESTKGSTKNEKITITKRQPYKKNP